MADEEDITIIRSSPHWGRRIAIGVVGLIAALLLIVLGVYVWLGTDSGRGFVAKQVRALAFDNGMTIGMDRIEGSIFGQMRIRGLSLSDPKGVFLNADTVDMDWRPLAYARSHVDIRSLMIPTAHLYRQPQFKATPPTPDAPLLPDLDIDINRLQVGRLQIDPPLTGKRHLIALDGQVHIADRRAQVTANGRALLAPGVAGGDRLALILDAVPDKNRFDIDLKVNAPAAGLIAGFTQVAKPLDVTLAGKGDWAAWTGKLTGTMGSDRIADVALTARNGTFTVRGPIRPGLFVAGAGRNMLEPITRLDLTATAQDRNVRLHGGLASDNFTFAANGLVDLGKSAMQDLKLDFKLLKPSVIATNLSGADVSGSATLNGSFTAPHIAYGLIARQIGFAATSVEGLSVSGSATLDKDQWRIPIHGTARRIAGLNASIAPLLTNVRLDGDFAYANARLLSDNLKIRSDRIDATAIVVADLNKALYTGALQVTVNGYKVESVGIFNLKTNMDLKTGANGYFKLGGRVTARSTRLLNDGMRSFLGGNALIVADVGYDSNGLATLDRLNVAAPGFRLTGGTGQYRADGSIRFSARGSSNQYGPIAVEASGTIAKPVARIVAARPGMGMGLSKVVATIRSDGKGYAVVATGDSDYGAFNANVGVGLGPLRVDLKPGTQFAGIGMTGRVTQTATGPFAGTINANGSGINALVQLSSFSGKQRAVVNATAQNASLPGRVGFSTDRAIVAADVILYTQPQVVADVQLAGTHMGDLTIAVARANVNYRGGQGQAKLLVEGRTRYPFRMAANAVLDPKLWRVAMKGRFNGVDITTKGPLRILPEKAGYTLQPGTIETGQGNIQLAGRYGPGMMLQSRLNGVNLAIANPFMPTLGLGGTATGSLDFAQNSSTAFPSADARLEIKNFTRTSLASVSQPVDIHVVGRLLPEGGNARAIIRRRGAAIGRLQVNLNPLPPGAGSWTTRLLGAPLTGGLRYNGPADVLFSLAALPDQSLKGPIGIAADFGGRAQTPTLTGVVRANTLTYENATYGTKLTNMKIAGRFTDDRLEVESLTANAGSGTVKASGFVSLSSAQGFPIQLGLDMDRAQLATGNDLAAQVTGQLRIVNGNGQPPTVSGKISLPETRYRIVRQGAATVATLTGVRRKPALGLPRISGDAEPISSLPSTWRLDLDVVAQNQIYVSGMGLDSEWSADMHIGGTSGAPVISGGVDLIRGTLGFAGRSFTLQEGRIRFNGGPMFDPDIRIVASGEVQDVTINVNITGTGTNPQIAFTSTPSLPQDELMARILFGNSVGELSAIQAVQLAASLNSLRGGKGGLNPLGVLQSSAGIDRLRILGEDKTTGRGTSVAVGQYISNDVYVEVVTDARGYTATQLEISLSKALSVLSQMGSFGGSSVNLRYRKDY